jgi:hypothetical protein
MPRMLRRFSILIAILAVLIAAEPLLHHHPLQQNSIPGACAICATGATPLPLTIAAVAAPQFFVYTLTVVAATTVTTVTPLTLASRAPPAL